MVIPTDRVHGDMFVFCWSHHSRKRPALQHSWMLQGGAHLRVHALREDGCHRLVVPAEAVHLRAGPPDGPLWVFVLQTGPCWDSSTLQLPVAC